MKPRLAIDFDGTIVEDSWPAIGDWMPGAVPALRYLSTIARISVHTCRISPVWVDEITRRPEAEVAAEINAIREKLDRAGLTQVKIHTDPWKPPAIAYVDNRAVRYTGRPNSWKNLVPKLAAMCGVEEEIIVPELVEGSL